MSVDEKNETSAVEEKASEEKASKEKKKTKKQLEEERKRELVTGLPPEEQIQQRLDQLKDIRDKRLADLQEKAKAAKEEAVEESKRMLAQKRDEIDSWVKSERETIKGNYTRACSRWEHVIKAQKSEAKAKEKRLAEAREALKEESVVVTPEGVAEVDQP